MLIRGSSVGRVGALAAALGAGFVIAISAAGAATADDSAGSAHADTGRRAHASQSDGASRAASRTAPTRQATRSGTPTVAQPRALRLSLPRFLKPVIPAPQPPTAEPPAALADAPAVVTFAFNYLDSSWTPEAKTALESTANTLATRFTVTSPTTLTLNVTGMNKRGSLTLAYSSADFASGGNGFFGTVIQTKILTGVDPNGSSADATITYNFAYPWALGDTVSTGQYDLKAVALHELLHAFGFLTGTETPTNSNRNWSAYDKFLSTSTGTRVIDSNFSIIRSYVGNFTGSNGGLFFSGTNAVAANGGKPVKLYTPSPWSGGSSVSHVDPVANPGFVMKPSYPSGKLGPRVLSPVEVAIMKDLYTKTDGTIVFTFVLVVFRLRRRTR